MILDYFILIKLLPRNPSKVNIESNIPPSSPYIPTLLSISDSNLHQPLSLFIFDWELNTSSSPSSEGVAYYYDIAMNIHTPLSRLPWLHYENYLLISKKEHTSIN